MTKKRTGEPWMPAREFGKTLRGLSLNLIVRDPQRSLPFYTEVLGFTALYSDPDFAALARGDVRVQLHAGHTYEEMPWAPRLGSTEKRGLGAEIRILGIDPDGVEHRARERGYTVVIAPRVRNHGWRETHVEDPDGYVFAVGMIAD